MGPKFIIQHICVQIMCFHFQQKEEAVIFIKVIVTYVRKKL